MRRRFLADERDDPMGLFMDPVMDFIGLMFFMVIFLIIFIQPKVSELRIVATEPPPCAVGLPYQFTIAVQGGMGDRHLTYENQLPQGLSFDKHSGTIYGVAEKMTGPDLRKIRFTVRD